MNYEQKVILGKHKIYTDTILLEYFVQILCEAPLKIVGKISFKGPISAYTCNYPLK